jgi:hypothetical protein
MWLTAEMIREKIGIQHFAEILANQLIHLRNMMEKKNDSIFLLDEEIGFNLGVPSMMITDLLSQHWQALSNSHVGRMQSTVVMMPMVFCTT